MKNKRGFTLIEVIISLAVIGVIAVGIIPAFAAQLQMTLQTRSLTTGSFGAQGIMEQAMSDLKIAMIDPSINAGTLPDVTVTKKILFGKSVDVYRLQKTFPSSNNKSYLVFLSKKLAQMEVRTLLAATGVRIEVSGETVHETADLKKSPKPELIGKVDAFPPGSTWFANLYKWYVSKEGDTDPIFPEDYGKITLPGVTPPRLADLTKLANRYVVFTVTPVDIHGIRGNETVSTNRVYILGEEWRSGIFAWVDKDADAIYQEDTDVKVEKKVGFTWHLLDGFDTAVPFPDPANPVQTLNPKDGSLYVPMGIDRALPNPVGTIDVAGVDWVSWTADRSIHLATDIRVLNNSGINMEARDGSIILYRFLEIDPSTGNAKFDASGKPLLINDGAKLVAAGGDINLRTSGRGDVTLQEFARLDAGKNLLLRPYGNINLTNNVLSAGGSVTLDTSKGSAFPGNRDISIRSAVVTLKPNAEANRAILLLTPNRLKIFGTVFNGNADAASVVRLSATEGVEMTDVSFTKAKVELESHARMHGGGWDESSTVKVADGKQLSLGVGTGRVNNAGKLILGNTGAVDFINTMASDVANPLKITLRKGETDQQVMIETNYGRNLGYADSGSGAIGASLQDLGSGQTNMRYAIAKVGGHGSAAFSAAYDGDRVIALQATADGAASAYYQLTVSDRFVEEVSGTIVVRVTATGSGDATVTVIGDTVPTHTVTFRLNYDDLGYQTMTAPDGSTVDALPDAPVRAGYNFCGWNSSAEGGGTAFTAATIVTADITVYAQWAKKVYWTLTFNSNGGSYIAPIPVEQGVPIGSLLPPPPKKTGYAFQRWTDGATGGNTIDGTTILGGNTTAYAQWVLRRPFSDVKQGEFVLIGGSLFQKLSAATPLLLLASQSIGPDMMTWENADAFARSYWSSFGLTEPWVTGSGLMTGDMFAGNSSAADRQNILASPKQWWGQQDPGYVSWAYLVTTSYYANYPPSVNVESIRKVSYGVPYSYYVRPYITLNATGLWIISGTGTAANPYTLEKQ